MTHRHSAWRIMAAIAITAVVASGCSSSATPTAAPPTAPPATMAPATMAPSTSAVVASTAPSSDPVQAAIDANNARKAPQTTWTGPTTGPTADPGKTVVYISSDEANQGSHLWGVYQQEAGKVIGWKVTVLDGKGTTSGRLTACNQALVLKPDAITFEGDAVGLQSCLTQADAAGIVIVGVHAAGTPGPQPSLHLYTNISSDPSQIGTAMADWIIADSKGKGKAMILYDNLFDVARAKAEAMKAEFAKCTGCTLLGYENSPLAEVTTRTAPLFTAYESKYGADFQYVMSITDYYYDFAVPALQSAGVPTSQLKLVGSDGNPSAYERIRAGNQYQVATVPEPAEFFGWQIIDEVNRGLHKVAPSGYAPPIYIVDQSNVNAEGGVDDIFQPSNNFKAHYLAIWTGKAS
jgi:ribose transport system substrate-binding protein